MAPPMPPAALQPPAPRPYFGNRPSFSYNVVSHANASLPTGQQFQLDTVISHGFIINDITIFSFLVFNDLILFSNALNATFSSRG